MKSAEMQRWISAVSSYFYMVIAIWLGLVLQCGKKSLSYNVNSIFVLTITDTATRIYR